MDTPCTLGSRPVISEARYGWQIGVATWKLSNTQASAARRSMCGVRTIALP
jgi:hypothetical protein